MFNILRLETDGDSLDLLQANRQGWGIGLNSYTPGMAQYKDGGIWADSPLSPGRRRVAGQQANYNDALTLKIAQRLASQTVEMYRDLKFFESLANSYWDDEWQRYPVWLAAQAAGETAVRYAIIYMAQLSDLPNPYDQPYAGGGTMAILDAIVLGIERGPWTDTPPLQATQVPLRSYDVEEITNDWLWLANGYNPHGGLTHIYSHTIIDGDTDETDSGNWLAGDPPYPLYEGGGSSDGPEIDSAVYFGSDYKFGGLVFNLSQALFPAFGTKAIEWEYWNGVNWSPVDLSTPELGVHSYRDGTDQFGKAGTHAIYWQISDNWTKNSPRTYPEKFWMRARIADGFTYSENRPMQATRHVYALGSIPYVEVAGGQTDGDIDNLLRLRLLTEGTLASEINDFPADTTLPVVLRAGLRSYARGANFTPWLNLDTAFNPSGLNAAPADFTDQFPGATIGFVSAYTFNFTNQTLRIITPDSVDPDTEGTVWTAHFTRTILGEYYGEYRIFVRAYEDTVSPTDDVYLRYSAHFMRTAHPGVAMGEWVRVERFTWGLLDLGRLRIPLTSFVDPNELTREIYLRIQLRAGPEATVYLDDVFLLPIDEWSAEVDVGAFLNQQYNRIVNIDSAKNPRRPMRCLVEIDVNGTTDVERTATLFTTGEAILHSGTRQRLYFLLSSPNPEEFSLGPANGASLSVGVKAEAINRYTYLR